MRLTEDQLLELRHWIRKWLGDNKKDLNTQFWLDIRVTKGLSMFFDKQQDSSGTVTVRLTKRQKDLVNKILNKEMK